MHAVRDTLAVSSSRLLKRAPHAVADIRRIVLVDVCVHVRTTSW